MTITTKQAEARFGTPSKGSPCMVLWDVPKELEIGVIPKRIYCNKLLVGPLSAVFADLIKTGLANELHTWDGCFNIRLKRSGSGMSLHSWGLAVDINAFENPMGGHSRLSKELVTVFEKHGFEWGGRWKLPDPMHFQLKELP